jgi:CubicO group peptidase (beta-lactamase class C family)
MGLTRRSFLTTATICAAPATTFVLAAGPPREPTGLPDGVTKPFQWDARQIPSSGSGSRATTVLDKSIVNTMRKYGIVGCGVCVVRGTTIVYAKGFGYAQLPGTPFLSTNASRCGSVAKPITALCALVLADQRKLDLDAEVLPILKEAGIVPRPVGAARVDERVSRITIRNLMDQTSGLPKGTAYTAWRPDRDVAALHGLDRVPTAADVVSDGLGNVRLEFDPGTKFQYANANFVILARVIEAKSRMPFAEFLTRVAMPKFGVKPDEVYVSLNQTSPDSPRRGKNEAAYYQTSDERFSSFVPAERPKGRVYGEAYSGYATEAADGAGGIACTALGVGRILAKLHSEKPGLSRKAISEILTPPSHYARQARFDPANSTYYSKGFDVRFSGGRPWLSHGGMTLHCGGIIGHNAGYQFVAVSNWNNSQAPFVDSILDRVMAESVREIQ